MWCRNIHKAITRDVASLFKSKRGSCVLPVLPPRGVNSWLTEGPAGMERKLTKIQAHLLLFNITSFSFWRSKTEIITKCGSQIHVCVILTFLYLFHVQDSIVYSSLLMIKPSITFWPMTSYCKSLIYFYAWVFYVQFT